MIKTLFFDVGYTLINEDAVWRQRCREQAEEKNGFSNLEKHVSLFKGVKQKVEE